MGNDECQFEEHEESIRCHPHSRHQSEVMQQSRCHDTDLKRLHLIDSNDKEYQHENHGHAELQSELGIVSLPQLSVEKRGS